MTIGAVSRARFADRFEPVSDVLVLEAGRARRTPPSENPVLAVDRDGHRGIRGTGDKRDGGISGDQYVGTHPELLPCPAL